MLDPRQLEQPLSERDIKLRDSYVAEYLRDFDPFKACLRLGFQPTYALVWSKNLAEDGYVQRKIAYVTRRPPDDPEEEAEDLALVKQTLRMVMRHGSDSARATAAHKMMVLRKWDKLGDGDEDNGDLAEQFRRVAENLPT